MSHPSRIQNVKALESEELVNLLIDHAPVLHEYVARRIPAKHRAAISPEDVLQEVWRAALRYFPQFDPEDPDAVVKWLMAVTKSRLVNIIQSESMIKRGRDHVIIRQKRSLQSSVLDLFEFVISPSLSPSGDVSAKEVVDEVRMAMDRLPENRRKVIWMYHIEGKSRGEIATAMGKKLPAVMSLLTKGRSQLRKLLGSSGRFFNDANCPEEFAWWTQEPEVLTACSTKKTE